MESTKEREDGGISELIQARQEALNMLLVARLEGQSNRVVADAVRRAQSRPNCSSRTSLAR